MTPATWRVGTFVVPAATGTQTITGLGGKPKALLFFGTNWTAEDAVVSTVGTGMFRGMVAPKYDAPSTLAQNFSFASPGDHHWTDNYALGCLTLAAGNMFYATCTSFDADGFTLNWLNTSGGGTKVVWVALMDVDHVAGVVGAYNATVGLGFKAGASLLHGCWGGPIAYLDDRSQEFWGGAAYPGVSSTSPPWESAGLASFLTHGSGSHITEITSFNPTSKVVSGAHGGIGGSFVSSNIVAYPTGSGLTSFVMGGDAEDGGMVVAWDDEDSRTRQNTPAAAVDGTVTQTGLPFAPGLLLGYTISDEPFGQGTGNRGAIGMSVVAPGFQWCATVDTVDPGSYQSFARGFADTVHGSSVHAGTVALTADGWTLTTKNAGVAPTTVLWHAFGHPKPQALWTPQIYRRVMA